MERAALLALLEAVQAGGVSVAAAAARLSTLPAEDLGFARLDHQRALRDGLPEAILAQGKTPMNVRGWRSASWRRGTDCW